MAIHPVSLEVGGITFQVGALRGRAALSSLFRFEVTAHIEADAPAVADLLGQPFVLVLEDAFDARLEVRGVVVRAEAPRDVVRGGRYHLSLGPEVEPLAVGRDHRVFQEQTAIDAMKDVLERGGLLERTRFELSASFATRAYLVQYGESDWSFIERLAREEGLAYWFAPVEGETTLVFSDDTTACSDLPGGGDVPFTDASGLGATRDAIVRLTREKSVTSNAVTLRDHQPDTPRVLVEGKAKEEAGDLERYDWHARVTDPDAAARRAQLRLEALRAERDVLRGEASGVRFFPGWAVSISGHPLPSMSGRFLLLETRWDLAHARDGATDQVAVRFTAIPDSTPWRPAAVSVDRSPGGPQTGVVVGPSGEEIHTDDTGRLRVQFHWDRLGKKDDKASTFMRVGQVPLGGSMIHPRIGWDVVVHHGDDDVDAPFITGHLYDGEHPVPYALPANKTRTAFQTATTPGGGSNNEIRFEDAKGSEEMYLEASNDQNVVVGDKYDEKVGVDHVRSVGGDQTIRIGTTSKSMVGTDQTLDVGGSESLTISGTRNVEVGGSETVKVGGSRTLMALKGTSLDAKGGRTLTVGGSMIGASVMEVGRSTLGTASVTVAGAWIQAAAQGVSSVVLGACAETVGGAKIQAAAATCGVSGKGAVAETVGGAYVIAAGGDVSQTSTGTLRITVGGALIANAPTISIEADSEILIQAGASSLTITSSSVEIKAPAMASPAGVFDLGGSVVEHN